MIYLFITYLTFLVVYDHWASDAVNWQIAYFVAQYSFIASMALTEIRRGKYVMIYFVIVILFATLIIIELLCVNSSIEQYNRIRSGPPALALTSLVVIAFLYLIKEKKWSGLKLISGRR
jgi:hypothetical protein